MPWVRYPELIRESVEQLAERERQVRGRRTQARVQLLRLLKAGQVNSLRAGAPLVGYSVREVHRWWAWYRAGGLERLVAEARSGGRPSRLTPAAWAGLEAEMAAGRIATLADARQYLRQQWGIVYRSLQGVWWQLRRRRAKPKTGRRRHRRADPVAQEAYKRRLRTTAARTAVRASLGVR